MSGNTRWITVVGLSATATASLSFGISSDGSRGVVFGLALPLVCIVVLGFLTDMLVAMLAAVAAGAVATGLANRIGGDLDNRPDAVINLLPLFSILLLLGAAAVGMLCRLLSDHVRDGRHVRRPPAN